MQGTWTFLFTDIEGSTKLWASDPERMRAALARHDAILREVFEQQGGHVFKTIGDAFCVAFPDGAAGIAAAAEANRRLAAAEFEVPIRIRQSLHKGSAESRDGDYFGPTLNETARILSLVNAGQIVVSAHLADDCSSAEFIPLGEYWLKDIPRPIPLLQCVVEGQPSQFPPLRGAVSGPSSLPFYLTEFFGREREFAAIESAFQSGRLVSLLGPGGTGKTRLSVEFAKRAEGAFSGGRWFLGLADLNSAALAEGALDSMLGVTGALPEARRAQRAEVLGRTGTLLIIDNCEHLGSDLAQWVTRVISASPQLKVLVTSRRPLGLPGEICLTIDPLASDSSDGPSDAERLFIARAKSAWDRFEADAEALPLIRAVVTQLDGIPLALELAASRIRTLSLEKLAERLAQHRLSFKSLDPTASPRQQTLRSAIAWSHDLLSPEAKTCFRRLAVFVGGWTSEAAELVAADDKLDGFELGECLESLTLSSMVQSDPRGARFHFLETIREFALEQLREAGEEEELRSRHAEWIREMAEEWVPRLHGPEHEQALLMLRSETENVRAALNWSAFGSLRLQIAVSLTRFWMMKGASEEGIAWLKSGLAQCPEASVLRGRGLNALGMLHWQDDRYAAAKECLGEAIALFEVFSEDRLRAGALSNLGAICADLGLQKDAEAASRRAIALYEALGETGMKARVLTNLGSMLAEDGRSAEALQALAEASDALRAAGDRLGLATALSTQCELSLRGGLPGEAVRLLGEAFEIRRQFQDVPGLYFLAMHLADCLDVFSTDDSAAWLTAVSSFAQASGVPPPSKVMHRLQGVTPEPWEGDPLDRFCDRFAAALDKVQKLKGKIPLA